MEEAFSLLQLSTVFLTVAVLVLAILHRLRFDGTTMCIFVAAIMCSMLQFASTTPLELANDPLGHLYYIQYIHEYNRLPPALSWQTLTGGWQSQQPPLYYSFAALMGIAGERIGWPFFSSVRVASVVLYFGAAIFAGLLLRLLVPRKPVFYVCLLFVLFWPVSSATSVKITSDVGTLFWASGFIYFLVRWLAEERALFFALLLGCCGGAIATKASGLLPMVMLGGAFAWQWLRRKARFSLLMKPCVLVGLAVFLCGLSIYFGRIYYWKYHEQADLKWLLNRGDDYVGNYEHTGNGLQNYMRFDALAFVEQPFLRINKAAAESQLFFNVWLKSLLFGDHTYPHARDLGSWISLNLLALIAWFFASAALCIRRTNPSPYTLPAPVFMMLGAIAAIMTSHIMIPVISQGSGRYMYICVALFAAMSGNLICRLLNPPRAWWAAVPGLLLMSGMTALSMAFIAWQWIYGIDPTLSM